MRKKMLVLCAVCMPLGFMLTANAATLIDLNFNTGTDDLGQSQGNLVFHGTDGFQVFFTDDDSYVDSITGGADGVHLTNENFANIKVGSSDLVLGAYNSYTGSNNYHSSGIVAVFNCGVELVRFFDTDDDGTKKTLFAFDEYGKLIGRTHEASQITFQIDTSMTGGTLIHKVEFDTQMGTLGGASDGTYFTIDNFYVEGNSCGGVVPQPPCSDNDDTASLKFTMLEKFYSVGDNIVIDLIENLEISNRFERNE